MKLYYLIYISKAHQHMQSPDLTALLDECRAFNELHALTGMLLYLQSQRNNQSEGRFIQVLEGEQEVVRHLFEKIKEDERHYNVIVINEGSLAKRNFKKWSMGFETMDMETYEARPGHFELNDEFLLTQSQQQFNLPLNFLKTFYQMRLRNTA